MSAFRARAVELALFSLQVLVVLVAGLCAFFASRAAGMDESLSFVLALSLMIPGFSVPLLAGSQLSGMAVRLGWTLTFTIPARALVVALIVVGVRVGVLPGTDGSDRQFARPAGGPAAQPNATLATAPVAARATLVIGASFDIKTLDPARGLEQIGGMVHKATYNTLVTLAEDDISQIVPDLAESWTVSSDARTFTYRLRRGVRFHTSGNEMTSADVKWSLERAMGIKGNPSFLLEGISSVEAPDPYTVVINKVAPDPAFIAKGSFSVYCGPG